MILTKRIILNRSIAQVAALYAICQPIFAVTFPSNQHWAYEGAWHSNEQMSFDSPTDIAATQTQDGERIVVLDGEFIKILDTNGTPIESHQIGPNLGKMEASHDGKLFVLKNASTIVSYGLDGVEIQQIPISSVNPYTLTIDSAGRVFLASKDIESGEIIITRFSSEGEEELQWEVPNAERIYSLGIDHKSQLFVRLYTEFSVYDTDGLEVASYNGKYDFGTKDGFAFSSDGSFFGVAWLEMQHRLGAPYELFEPNRTRRILKRRGSGYEDGIDVTIGSDDSVYFLRNDPFRIEVMRRTYSGILDPDRTAMPLPEVLSTSMIEGANQMRIRYRVTDPDSQTVDVRAWVVREDYIMPNRNFWDYFSFSLRDAIPIQSVIGGQSGKLGDSVPTNTEIVFDWDAGSDLGNASGKYKVFMMANDGRQLLNLHFLTIPAEGELPSLELARAPTNMNWFYEAFLWMYFSSPSDYELSETGEVYPKEGPFANQWITFQASANGNPGEYSTLNFDGADYVAHQLGYRRASNEEVLRALEAGTSGSVLKQASGLETSPNDHVLNYVNEWGFDSGYSDDYLNETEAREWIYWLVKE